MLMHQGPVFVGSTIENLIAWEACSVLRKADQAVTNSESCWMQGPLTTSGLSIGFETLLLSL